MIISHKYQYIYLEPVGTEAHIAHQYFRDMNLIDADDIVSGVYIANTEIYPPQNFTPLSLQEYQDRFGLNDYTNKPMDSIMQIVNSALTPQELIALGTLEEQHLYNYKVYAPIRNPLDRFCSQINASKWCRPLFDDQVFVIFVETLLYNRYTHLLWQDQIHYHVYKGKHFSTPLLYEKYYPELNKILFSFGLEREDLHTSHRALYSTEYMQDRQIDKLKIKFQVELEKRYTHDIQFWKDVHDSIL